MRVGDFAQDAEAGGGEGGGEEGMEVEFGERIEAVDSVLGAEIILALLERGEESVGDGVDGPLGMVMG